jgi:PilZ domain
MIEDERPGQTVLMNQTERRKSPRTPIRRLAYVNLEPHDNGGVITDISCQGLRFHMVKPVEHGGVVRLSILLGATNHVDAVGELVWMDASRKVGGVRFTVLPAGAADQILSWAKASNTVDTSAAARRSNAPGAPIPNLVASRPLQAKTDVTPAVTREVTKDKHNVAAAPTLNEGPKQAAPAQAAPETKARSPRVPPSVRPALGPETTAPPSHNLAGAATQPGDPRQANAMPWITHFDPDPPVREGSFLRGVLSGFLICALLVTAAWFGFRHYGLPNGFNPFGNTQAPNPVASSPVVPHGDPATSDLPPDANTVNSLPADQGQATSPSFAPSAQPNSITHPDSNTVSPDPFAPKAAPQAAAPAPQAPASPQTASPQAPIAQSPAAAPLQNTKANASQPPLLPDAGQSQLMLARQYLDGRVQPRNPTVASQLLWSAVEKGNSAAEMDLADLYLHGDGVPRNCDQARVLLSVASEKGNAEAMEKLRELNRTGCR